MCTVGNKNILFGVSNILSSILYIKQNKSEACLISLDFFKAYDRVLLDFLLLVMKKMNFGDCFISWIKMLHSGAKTRFILTFLTRAIDISFSIRQGDPLAMILYIIYIEPLLLYLERVLVGVQIAAVRQTLEAYCDDLNIITNNEADFVKIDETIVKFEKMSGALLSRDKKCKVIGFGNWRDREVWPLKWLRTENEIKIFGIFISDSYREIIKKNWDFRFSKFSAVVNSWAPRVLDTLQQRVEVVRLFALSRVFYVGTILPIKPSMVKKFESLIGRFIWKNSGKVLRIPIGEIKNSHQAGGLNLPCLASMCDSLMISQVARLLRSGDLKSSQHLDYWVGELLRDIIPWMGKSEHAFEIPEYFDHMGEILVKSMAQDLLSTTSLGSVTNKVIYQGLTATSFPTPKVVRESEVDYKKVWKRLHLPIVTPQARDVQYLLIHNKLPVPDRLFRIGLNVDPYCSFCEGGVFGDVEHFFCTCSRVGHIWSWIRARILGLLGGQGAQISNWELINLFLPTSGRESEIVWLISTYVHRVWEDLYVRNNEVKFDQFFGYLSFKYKSDQLGSGVTLRQIEGISYAAAT